MALVLMSLIGFLAMAIWMLAWRATHDTIRVERVSVQRELRARSTLKALALAADLLRTGIPPESPYECLFAVDDEDDEELFITTRFTRDGSNFDWEITAMDSTSAEVINLPLAPLSF